MKHKIGAVYKSHNLTYEWNILILGRNLGFSIRDNKFFGILYIGEWEPKPEYWTKL